MGLRIPTTYLVYLVSRCQVKQLGLRMRTSLRMVKAYSCIYSNDQVPQINEVHFSL